MKLLSIFLVVFTSLFTGCFSSKSEPIKSVHKETEAKQIDSKNNLNQSKLPKWINNPYLNGRIGAVGIVKKMKNKKKQNYIAKKLAIASLQEIKRVMVDSTVVNTESELVQEIKHTSSHYNSYELIQEDEFSDDEYYYVWMVVKK